MEHQHTQQVPPTLTAYEAARLMKVTPATIYAWIDSGEFPHLRLGGRIRIPTAKLADMLGVSPQELTDGMRQRVTLDQTDSRTPGASDERTRSQ